MRFLVSLIKQGNRRDSVDEQCKCKWIFDTVEFAHLELGSLFARDTCPSSQASAK